MLTRVEKYQITGEIGHGGMATVYRALDTRLDRPVALKVMHPHLQGAKEARARFAREALSVARLRHPGILEIYDYSGEESEISYIATELLTGPTLKRFAEQHPEIPAEIAACFVIAVARALKAAHAEGIIHRDVKPENVLIHQNREVKLTDFGIAQLVDAQSMTTTGQVLGSPGHMAPEQVEGRDCGVTSDLFSLGTVLYLLATGSLPFSGRNPHQVLKQIVEGRFEDPLKVRPSIGGRLRAIILRCLQTDPAQRYQSAAELEEDLAAFVSEVGIGSPTEKLAEYLSDPDAVGSSLRARTLEHLIEAGADARSKGEISLALDYYNRALALDEGNARVLAELEEIGRRSSLRNRMRILRIVLATSFIAGLAWLGSPDQWTRPVVRWISSLAEAGTPEGSSGSRTSPVSPAFRSKGERDPVSRSSVHGTAVASENQGGESGIAEQTRRESSRPRRVVFNPVPANVLIGIDGETPRAFGPSFREILLSPGIHRFKLVGAHECCIDQEYSVKIPPGPGTTVLDRTLQFKPAGLYVISNTPANVSVDDGEIRGRVRSVIQVPHRRGLVENHRITVTATGYKDYTQDIELQAGRLQTVNVTLEAIEGK